MRANQGVEKASSLALPLIFDTNSFATAKNSHNNTRTTTSTTMSVEKEWREFQVHDDNGSGGNINSSQVNGGEGEELGAANSYKGNKKWQWT